MRGAEVGEGSGVGSETSPRSVCSERGFLRDGVVEMFILHDDIIIVGRNNFRSCQYAVREFPLFQAAAVKLENTSEVTRLS